MAANAQVRAAVAAAHRDEWGAVFGATVRLTGDWMLAEDCTQDAFVRALTVWQRDGVPRRPGAWLVTTARNRALDVLRRRSSERDKLGELASAQERAGAWDRAGDGGDERLDLIFTCCYPALPLSSRVALTLRAVCGLTTGEIARAFLVSESTVSQRILRAKRKIADAAIPYRVPPVGAREDRLTGVLGVIYLIYTEGYASGGPRPVRDDLAAEAIRLARLVAGETRDPEARGLLALLLLQHARRDARIDSAGHLVRLDEQDRSRWDSALIAEGAELARTAVRAGGWYGLQAALAAEHSLAPSAQATRWSAIVDLYDRLLTFGAHPVLLLNRAVALGMRDGAQATLVALDELGRPPELAADHALEAVRADALRRLGCTEEAAVHYRAARELAPNVAVAHEYQRRLTALDARSDGVGPR